MPKSTKPIIFLHIPKTGGNTFINAIQNIATQNDISYLRAGKTGFLPKFSFNYFKSQDAGNFFSGHFVFSDDRKIADLYTLVRDVHRTFFSNLYFHYFRVYLQKNQNLNNINKINEKFDFKLNMSDKDIPVILKLIENNLINSNTFTKTIAGISYEKYFYIQNDYKITQSDYEMATNNLKYFKMIGNIGSFKFFLEKFISFYGFKLHSYTHQNVSNYDTNFIDLMTKKLYQQIADYNFYDLLLIKKIEKLYN